MLNQVGVGVDVGNATLRTITNVNKLSCLALNTTQVDRGNAKVGKISFISANRSIGDNV
jgi:hypothetical protein